MRAAWWLKLAGLVVIALTFVSAMHRDLIAADDSTISRAAADRLERLKLIYQERLLLYAKGEIIQAGLSNLGREMATLDNRLAAINRQGGSLTMTANNLRQQIANLQRTGGSQVSIDLAQFQLTDVMEQYAALDADAAQVRGQGAIVQGQIDATQTEMNEHLKQCSQLRQQWLAVVDPFGKLPKRDHALAIKLLSAWISIDPKNASAYLSRGHAYDACSDDRNALLDYESAAKIGGGVRALALAAKGNLEHRMGDKRNATADLGKAIAADQIEPLVYVWRCRAYAADGKLPQAEKDIKRAIQLAPDDSEMHRQAALLYLRWTRITDRKAKLALTSAKKAVDLSGSRDWSCLSVLAVAYAANGDFEKAGTEGRRAADLASEDRRAGCEEQCRQFSKGEVPEIEFD